MSSIWNKALYFLGLDDESRELEDAAPPATQPPVATPADAPRGRRVEPPAGARWRPANTEARMETTYVNQATAVRQVPSGDAQAEVLIATEFSDAQLLADYLRNRQPVVLDLRDTEPDTVRRLVDFASGITYALEGTMQKIASGVILVAPARTVLGDDEVSRLADLGLYHVDA